MDTIAAKSERIVQLAGEAAAAQAALKKAQQEADRLAQRAEQVSQQARSMVDALVADTQGLQNSDVRQLVSSAVEQVDRLERQTRDLRNRALSAANATDVSDAEQTTSEMRPVADEVLKNAEVAAERCYSTSVRGRKLQISRKNAQEMRCRSA